MENNEFVSYASLLELQMKYRIGIIKDEDLTYQQIILLNRLYDMQIKKIKEENEKKRNKIMQYRRKLKCK